ncbi:RagB/SusD family nutrient uptake outer membrane protein [Desertivirga xinjiangensis]|uniref:RagB/SusD family nutrient uptake outer membrane protein n=1 Tax=Desertivirga xinjiangensis TaxID=539206 RepID=UPI00210F0CC7|nr:RagB/SusD family nutrient uptake outer membrane protein [Pedobacter xinjiangensis]
MKSFKYIISGVILSFSLSACQKIIDVEPVSNERVEDYYHNYNEVDVALTGCYKGLQEPLRSEWRVTDLRSDNLKLNVINSSSAENVFLLHLDTYELNTNHPDVYDYWLAEYKNIRSINYVLKSLGVKYSNGQVEFGERLAQVKDSERDQLAAEALFLRAYHYFNLVRLYGGVFLITEPLEAENARQINRSSVQDCWNFIVADLKAAETKLKRVPYGSMNKDDMGRATIWAVKGLLAKVYLTLDRKSEALLLLNDVIDNSGYGLESTYSSVFAISNEMNKEILFAVRFKAGGLGMGNWMANYFAPLASGNAVVNGDGRGHSYPSTNLSQAYKTPGAGNKDLRKDVNIGTYVSQLYTKKYLSQVLIEDDAENDFPVLRFADILLMKAEAIGFDGAGGTSVSIINQIRQRAGATTFSTGDFNAAFYVYPTDPSDVNAITDDKFEEALFNERRLELAFENQRFFDLLRTGKAVDYIRNYFASEFDSHYRKYTLTLAQLQGLVTQDRLLLPIPQREIDTNTQIKIAQNSGY